MSFSVFDALTENFEKIFKTMKERDDKRSKLHEVEKEITLVCFLQKLFEHFSRLSDMEGVAKYLYVLAI